jgi:ATP-binding cassette, subfamily B, bacterial
MAFEPNGFTWPIERLADAFRELTAAARLAEPSSNPLRAPSEPQQIPEWIEHATKQAGCEAEPLATTWAELPNDLAAAYPAILEIGDSTYLVILRVKGKSAFVLTPDLKRKRVRLADICQALRQRAQGTYRTGLENLLAGVAISQRKKNRATHLLLIEHFANLRFNRCWVFNCGPAAKPSVLLKQTGIIRNAIGIIAVHALQSLLWLASWALLGNLSFAGRMERGWIAGWVLLLLTMVPCQVMTTRLQGLLAVGAGWIIKRRLLCGAMKLRADEMRHGGLGSFLGQALEAETFETLALSGAVAGLLAGMEIILALCVLGQIAWVLAFWVLLTGWAAWHFLRRFEKWTAKRLDMTNDLVEAMVGHRTRLAQLPKNEWHESEDQALSGYLELSKLLDKTAVWLMAAIPRGWLLAGLACLAPAIAIRHSNQTSVSIILGGVLLAYTALRKLTGSSADIAAAWVAFKQIRPLLDAAARHEKLGIASPSPQRKSRTVIEADRLTYRYRATGKPALRNGSLTIQKGDRILLEGPSGGGKTTFASLLAGTRMPESGLLLAGGLDRETLGDSGWRKTIAPAPQFHENHILTETLAFNLLLGRGWPPTRTDMEEAEAVCRELGLGDLLDTMPGGLMQMVGEGGWQLSHGERSRVFIARALLQSAELVILDESFAALDPENARVALETTIKRANTLTVIAHP